MIRHVVMWKLKPFAEGAELATNAAKLKTLFDSWANIDDEV